MANLIDDKNSKNKTDRADKDEIHIKTPAASDVPPEEYDENLWIETTSLLIYASKNFAHRENIVVTELENTLIKPITKKRIYDEGVELYGSLSSARKFRGEFSLIIISNQIKTSDSNYDLIKLKLSNFINIAKIPVLALFALRPNYFMKPHTKCWWYIRRLYQLSHCSIKNVVVVSSQGGFVEEIFDKKTDRLYNRRISDDTDVAFAHNIGAHFLPVDTFLGIENLQSKSRITQWNPHIIAPELRVDYIRNIYLDHENKDVFHTLKKLNPADVYMIMIMGAPTSGKTTLAREIIKKWRSIEWGTDRAIKFIGTNKYSEKKLAALTDKFLKERFNVLLDGEFPNGSHRDIFFHIAARHKASFVVIEVNPGIEMSKLFNHVRVENDPHLTELTPLSKYYEYRGKYICPVHAIASFVSKNQAAYILYRPYIHFDFHERSGASADATQKKISSEKDILLKYRF